MSFVLPTIVPLDQKAMELATERQAQLTKPAGALGQLETISIQLAGITSNPSAYFSRKGVVVMAGDHGVMAEGVSAYPSEVTAQMVGNFLNGGAAVNVLARQAGATVTIVDMGVAAELPAHPQFISRKVRKGTRNMAAEPAMTLAETEQAIQAGFDIINAEITDGLDLVAIGEMGIGNTTAAAAITAVITNNAVADVTGRGTGIDDVQLTHKVSVIERALALHDLSADNPMRVLQCVGGYEIAGLVGVCLGAATRCVPIVLDGFIASSAALIAAELSPNTKAYYISGHNSVEQGHQAILKHLGVNPLIDLGLRLGEGSGAVLAFHLIEAASRTLNEMATFAEAAVSDKED